MLWAVVQAMKHNKPFPLLEDEGLRMQPDDFDWHCRSFDNDALETAVIEHANLKLSFKDFQSAYCEAINCT